MTTVFAFYEASPQSPVQVVDAFMRALVERRFDDAEALFGGMCPLSDDLEQIAEVPFVASENWGIFSHVEPLDPTRVELWVVDTEGASGSVEVPAGQPLSGIRVVLAIGEGRTWRIERVGR